MEAGAKERWNRRYAAETFARSAPEPFVCEVVGQNLPAGRALDVAAGAGRHALWLAAQGWHVHCIDIAEVGLDRCREAAREASLHGRIGTEVRDLEDGAPLGEDWDLIVSSHYLQQTLVPKLAEALAAGGSLIMIQPTEKNLERNPRPSLRFLVPSNALARWAVDAGLEVMTYREGWTEGGRHLARLWAKRKP